MTFVQLVPLVLGFLLLAAHFYRGEHFVLLAASLVAALLVAVRRPWAARAIQVLLALGALEWVRAAVDLVSARTARGEPFVRLALILGAVALFTALAVLLPQTRTLRAHFGRSGGASSPKAPFA
jgi:hypothetical protein